MNTYCLPKLWYKTACLDLRVGDSTAIASSVKAWLYQDMLEKPQELVMYRELESGGLAVHNVKLRAMAMLIHTFLSQAISPCFPTNLYYKSLYLWHVLLNRDIPNPGQPPFYSSAFFNIIRDVHENTPLNVAWVTVKQWYKILLEKNITHTCPDLNTPPVIINSKFEQNHPEVDFPDVYHLSRKYGLSPDQKSFVFKMIQDILPTRERLARLGKVK